MSKYLHRASRLAFVLALMSLTVACGKKDPIPQASLDVMYTACVSGYRSVTVGKPEAYAKAEPYCDCIGAGTKKSFSYKDFSRYETLIRENASGDERKALDQAMKKVIDQCVAKLS